MAIAALSGLGGGVAGVGPGAGAARAQSFELLSSPPGILSERAFALSADGSVAAGGRHFTPAGGFTWTRSGGMNFFGGLPGMPRYSWAYGLSGDGTVAVGGAAATRPEVDEVAYRYRVGTPALELLGVQSGYTRSQARGASGDGEAVVGYSQYGDLGGITQAFRWTRATGLVGLGFARPDHFASEATAISRDGTTIVGHGRGGSGYNGAFAWTQATGMVPLPGLDATGDARAFGVNHDGTIIVGEAHVAPFRSDAAMWINGVPRSLGIAPGFSDAIANAVSDDGTVVVGTMYGGIQTASIWTSARGMEPLSRYLAFHGVAVPPGINLLTATAVSADGMTIAGYTGSPGPGIQGWVATIPGPGSGAFLGGCCLIACRRRR